MILYCSGQTPRSRCGKKFIREILSAGSVRWTKHAKDEIEKDNISIEDVISTLRAGTAEPGEWENDGWRYRVRTNRFYVVVEFDEENPLLIVITAWRVNK